MLRWPVLGLFAFLLPLVPERRATTVVVDGPGYTADGSLKYPADYREWVFLTAGLDMSYSAAATAPDHSTFDNVFVNPSAYKGFKQTGVWPEGTVMVLENRGGEGDKSINKRGKTQSVEVTGLEVHVKDSAHLSGAGKDGQSKDGWGFYGFGDPVSHVSGKYIARPASCYTCHEEHAAVDTTFVQFYPTLQETAKAKGTFVESSSR